MVTVIAQEFAALENKKRVVWHQKQALASQLDNVSLSEKQKMDLMKQVMKVQQMMEVHPPFLTLTALRPSDPQPLPLTLHLRSPARGH